MEFSSAHEYITQQSLFSSLCDSGKFSPHIHVEEAYAVKSPCSVNGRRNSITCKDENIGDFESEVDSFDMHTVRLSGKELSIGQYIPVIPRLFFQSDPTLASAEVVAVTLDDIFVNEPLRLQDERYRVCGSVKIDTGILRQPVFQNKKTLLLFSGRDVLLEYLWENRESMRLFETLKKIGFYAVTTPNFSVFVGECPVGHAWNIKKGLVCGNVLEKMGIAVIPHVYAVNKYQLAKWCDWLKSNPGIKTIVMNCQLQRKSIVCRNMVIDSLRHLLSNTGVNVILHGSDNRIHNKLKIFQTRLYIASSGAFKNFEIKKQVHRFLYKSWTEAPIPHKSVH